MTHESDNTVRDQRLAAIIANELPLILNAADDARLQLIRILRVDAKTGGRNFVAFYGPDLTEPKAISIDQADLLLANAHGFIRSELAAVLNLKRVPQVSFVPDPTQWRRPSA